MGRSRKSQPFAVRLPIPLAEWVNRFAHENALTKSEIIEAAVIRYKKYESQRRNGKRKLLLDTIAGAEDGSKHSRT